MRPLLHGSCCANGRVWQVLENEGCSKVEEMAGGERRLNLARHGGTLLYQDKKHMYDVL